MASDLDPVPSHTTTAAALEALASVEGSEDVKAVRAAIRAIYLLWLEKIAEQLQELARQGAFGASSPPGPVPAGVCVLFADGLRLDVGRSLESKLKGQGLNVGFEWRWAPLPTVTSTAKPRRLAGRLEGVRRQACGFRDERGE